MLLVRLSKRAQRQSADVHLEAAAPMLDVYRDCILLFAFNPLSFAHCDRLAPHPYP
jgi:hypothetical protein